MVLFNRSSSSQTTQHLEGKKNIIPDWLTFEGDDRIENGKPIYNPVTFDRPCNLELTRRICLHFPQDVPQSFRISTLPKEILSFAQHVVQSLELSLILNRKKLMRQKIESGEGGAISFIPTLMNKTSLLQEYQQERKTSYSEFSLKSTENPSLMPNWDKLLDSVRNRWRETLLKRPRSVWLWCTGTVLGSRPFTDRYLISEDAPTISNQDWKGIFGTNSQQWRMFHQLQKGRKQLPLNFWGRC